MHKNTQIFGLTLSGLLLAGAAFARSEAPVDLLHARVTFWDYQDQTDAHEDLCRTREWLLGRHEAAVPVRANVLDLCDTLTGKGSVWLVEGPVPHSRWNNAPDFTVSGRGTASVNGSRLEVNIPSKLDFVWARID